jgi:hypothetical protein
MLRLFAMSVLLAGSSMCFAQTGAYSLSRIDYFRGDEAQLKEELPTRDLWREPVVAPDGTVSIYRPPAVVEEFLSDPNEATGLKYLAWARERMARIVKAQRVLEVLSAGKKAGP